ncbi:MerR family transcriptional regulator [bacterium]|jgi:DNA-binding transcriptional MerR regulator/methylmalonyl-CoA mutase cobalamin-binding subunit|nr:MerR family transcriptional regulator [bacterium]
MNYEYLSIGAVERDSGIARDTLRIWERRYGFPEPLRNDKGERMYPEGQLRRLQRIRRLLDQGLRPGKVVVLDDADLDLLEAELYPDDSPNESIEHILNVLQSSDGSELEETLSHIYQQQGMEAFITETVIPLLYTVGERWAKGKLQIFEEHLMSEVLTRFLNTEISSLQINSRKPRVLLATLPGEEHTLGLLMFAALLSARNINVTNLGGEVPLDQIVLAVDRLNADVLGLTFSAAYKYENIRSNINELRDSIPENVDLWLGGEGVKRMRKIPRGVTRFTSFDKLPI